jgi:hypothetical protein
MPDLDLTAVECFLFFLAMLTVLLGCVPGSFGEGREEEFFWHDN